MMDEQIKNFLEIYHLTSKIQGIDMKFRCNENEIKILKDYHLTFYKTTVGGWRRVIAMINTRVGQTSFIIVRIGLDIDSQKTVIQKLAEFYDRGAKDHFQMSLYTIHDHRQEYRLVFKDFKHYQKFILVLCKLIEDNRGENIDFNCI